MKKLIFSAAVLASAFFAASCQQELLDPVQGGSTVTFSVEIPEVAGTKANVNGIGNGADINNLVYAVYKTDKDENEAFGYLKSTDLVYCINPLDPKGDAKGVNTYFNEEGKAHVTLELVKNQKYVVLFWAQNEQTWVSGEEFDLTKITYPDPDELTANLNKYEAFCGAAFVDEVTGATKKSVTLTRPFAQINLASTDPANYDVDIVSSSVKIENAYPKFNVATKKAFGDAFRTVEYADNANPDGKFGNYDHYVAMNYIFANPKNDGTTPVKVTCTITTQDHGAGIVTAIDNVPVAQNYKTNIVGNLLTSDVDYEVSLNDSWGTPDEKVLVTDINPSTRTITINSVDELLSLNSLNENWIALFSNGQGTDITNFFVENGGKGADYYYKWDWTIKLNADLDLNNITLDAPINVSGFGCFDGKNHTIKNVRIETATDVATAAGLFEASKACKMQNIKLDNVHVAGSLVGNSNAGILVSDCNSGINNITITNSSVYGGKYTGGVVGYGYTYVTNCTLTNCVIKGGYKLGGVIGYICTENGVPHDVTGCTLTGCTVSGTDGQYADGKSEYVMGKVVGNYNCNGTCSNNTVVTTMATKATNIIGKIEAGKNVTIENNVLGASTSAELVAALKTAVAAGETNIVFDAKGANIGNFNKDDNTWFTTDLVPTGVTVTLRNATVSGISRWNNANGTLIFENCTFTNNSAYSINFGWGNGHVKFTNCELYGWCSFSGVTVEMNDCNIAGNGSYALVRSYNTFTMNNCTIDGSNAIKDDDYPDGVSIGDGAVLTMTGCTMTDAEYDYGESLIDGNRVVDYGENSSYIIVDGKRLVCNPSSLEYALKNGNAILMENNITVEAHLTNTSHGTNINIDGGGNELTLRGIYGVSGANVSLSNMTLVDSKTDDYTIFNQGGKIELNNVTYNSTINKAFQMAGGGDVVLTDCNISGDVTGTYSASNIWCGDGRNVTVNGGTYGSIFMNAQYHSGWPAASAHAASKITLNDGTITKLILETELGAEGYYVSATLTQNGGTITNLVENPQNLDLTGRNQYNK